MLGSTLDVVSGALGMALWSVPDRLWKLGPAALPCRASVSSAHPLSGLAVPPADFMLIPDFPPCTCSQGLMGTQHMAKHTGSQRHTCTHTHTQVCSSAPESYPGPGPPPAFLVSHHTLTTCLSEPQRRPRTKALQLPCHVWLVGCPVLFLCLQVRS